MKYKTAAFLGMLALGGILIVLMHNAPQETVSLSSAVGVDCHTPKIVRGIGFVEPVTECRRLTFKAEGVIAGCNVEIGQTLEKHAVLMSLDSDERRAEVAVAEAELNLAIAERQQTISGISQHRIMAAQQNVDRISEQLRHAEKSYERMHRLFLTHAISRQDHDDAETEALQQKSNLKQAAAEVAHLKEFVKAEDRQVADAKVSRAQARLALAQERLDDANLRAPCDGIVLEILKRPGEAARSEDREPAVIFADAAHLRVRAEIDERYVSRMKVGHVVTVHGRGLGKNSIDGRIAVVKRLMGKKTVFTHDSSERKDLDVLQVLVDLPESFEAPLGLQVDIDIRTD